MPKMTQTLKPLLARLRLSSQFDKCLTANWYTVKERWVHYLKNAKTNLGNNTTNCTESLFGKLKQIVKSKVSLAVCLRQLLQFVNSTNLQSDFTHFCSQNKITYNHLLSSDVNEYGTIQHSHDMHVTKL